MSPARIVLLGSTLGVLLACTLFFLLSCTDHPTLDVAPREGTSVDPCVACWDLCGDAPSQREAIFCSQACSELCAVLRQDGGA